MGRSLINILPDANPEVQARSVFDYRKVADSLRLIELEIMHKPVEHLCLLGANGELLKRESGDEEKCLVSLLNCTCLDIAGRGNLVLTHNHPEEEHACLSLPDISTAIGLNLRSIRAVTPTGQVCYFNKPHNGFEDVDNLMLRINKFYYQCSVALSTGISEETNVYVRRKFNESFFQDCLSMDLTYIKTVQGV